MLPFPQFLLLSFYLNNTLLRGKKTPVCSFGEAPLVQHHPRRRRPDMSFRDTCDSHPLTAFLFVMVILLKCITYIYIFNLLKPIVWIRFTFLLMTRGSHDLLLNAWATDRGRSFVQALRGLRLLCSGSSRPHLPGFSVCLHCWSIIPHFSVLSLHTSTSSLVSLRRANQVGRARRPPKPGVTGAHCADETSAASVNQRVPPLRWRTAQEIGKI